MKALQLAFWDIEPRLLAEFRESLRVFYWRVPQVSDDPKPMLWDENIDRLIRAGADRPELEWLAVFAVGTVFPDQNRITTLIAQAIENVREKVLVMGQLIDKAPRFCGIHEQLFLVNLKTYRELGMPSFGGYEKHVRRFPNYIAGESFHDGYTPKEVRPAPGESERETWTCGWGFVEASLRAGLPIFNLPERLREEKIYAYPDDNLERLNRNLERLYAMEDMPNATQRKVLGYLVNKRLGYNPIIRGSGVNLVDRENSVFLFNTEKILPDVVWTRENGRPLDQFIGPCSGFLDLATLEAYGFHPGTKLVLFDVNGDSIAFKERMRREFDGDLNGLPAYFDSLIRQAESHRYWLGDPSIGVNRLLEIFGTRERFAEAWRAYRELSVEFVRLNLLSSPEEIFRRVSRDGRSLIAISDIFTGQNELTYGISKMRAQFRDFIKKGAENPRLIISGKDPEGMPFVGYAREL